MPPSGTPQVPVATGSLVRPLVLRSDGSRKACVGHPPAPWSHMAMVFRVGLPLLILLVALAWFAFSSYRRAQIAEQAVAELKDQVRVLEKAVAAAEQGLRTLAANPSVPRDVALSADMTLNDIRRITDRKELGT